jgi:RHS repeat-associated protein
MGCLQLTYEPILKIVCRSGHKQTLARTKNRVETHKLKYNGKELQDELGLNFYDYGARNYDPALGRWMNVDPLSEKYFGATPYNYVLNNPINAIDPDGMDIYLLTESGRTILALKEKDKKTDTMFAVSSKGITDITSLSGTKELASSIYDMKDTNGDGQFNIDDGVTVKSGLIGQMVNNSSGKDYYSSKSEYSEENESAYLNLFKYSSDNSNVEFSLVYSGVNNKNFIELATYGNRAEAPGHKQLGVSVGNLQKEYHSHPGIRPNKSSERYSMGEFYKNQIYPDSDFGYAIDQNRTYPNYVYFPNSKKIYNVNMYSIELIKKINSSKDLKR